MNWLLWREYRRNRWILIAGATGVLLPYIIAVIFDADRSSGFAGAFFLSSVFSHLTVALLAGNAVAGERADRSAEFIAYLPWRRSSTFASKLLFPVTTGVVCCLVYLWGGNQLDLPEIMAHMFDPLAFVSGLLVVYSVAWLMTSYLSSVAYASCIGFVAPWLIVLPLFVSVETGEMRPKDYAAFVSLHAMICLAVAAVCFSVGTWIYFRSSES